MTKRFALPLISIRVAHESDRPFIFKSWLNSNYDGSSAGSLKRSVYFPNHWNAISKIYPDAKALIVHDRQDPDHILGFCVFRSIAGVLVVDYIYIKSAFRKMGLANHLFETAKRLAHKTPDSPWIYTHRTQPIMRFADKVGAVFNPYLMFGVTDEGEESQGYAGSHGGQTPG